MAIPASMANPPGQPVNWHTSPWGNAGMNSPTPAAAPLGNPSMRRLPTASLAAAPPAGESPRAAAGRRTRRVAAGGHCRSCCRRAGRWLLGTAGGWAGTRVLVGSSPADPLAGVSPGRWGQLGKQPMTNHVDSAHATRSVALDFTPRCRSL